MQAFADRAAILETLQTRLATFYSRSRKGRWCKGETSGFTIDVLSVHIDCDRDSLVYVGVPTGPTCHTLAPTCYFATLALSEGGAVELRHGDSGSRAGAPLPTLQALEQIIESRGREARERQQAEEGALGQSAPRRSWTAKLLGDPALTCSKIREEADELCRTWESSEGSERAASEAADLLYHAAVLLNIEGVTIADVAAKLRGRFGISGIDEKASRPRKDGAGH